MKKIAAIATGLALAAGLLVIPATAQAAPVLPAYGAGTYTFHDYIDGDTKKDTITITEIPTPYNHAERVTVTTAAGHTSSLVHYSDADLSWPYDGTAKMDPVAGKEIRMLHSYAEDSDTLGVQKIFAVMTWRNNKLVFENAPGEADWKAGTQGSWEEAVDYLDGRSKIGYYLFKSKGKWYDDQFDLRWNGSKKRWTGDVYRSVWKSGHWAGYKHYAKVSLTNSAARKYKEIAHSGD